MRRWTTAPVRAATVSAAAVLMLWPTVLNHHPYLFWDSYGYFTQGLGYWQLILGGLGIWEFPPEAAIEQGWQGAAARLLALDPAIRSIPYSLMLWPMVAGGGFWSLVLLSSLVAAYTVDVALERLFGLQLGRRVVVLLALALFSGLPWFTSYAMPDLWAGLLILAAATLLLAGERLASSQRMAMAAVVVLGAAFHASHLLLAALLALAAPLVTWRWRALPRAALPVLAAVMLSIALGWLFFGKASLAPQSPPFLLARQIEDGPAMAYLRASCPEAGWALCPVVDRLWPSAQEFLWSERDSYWAMEALRPAMRREEMAIVAAAASAYPWKQLEASLRNGLGQLARFGLEDHVTGRGASVTWDDYWFTFDASVPARRWGLGAFTAIIYLGTAAGLVVIVWHAWPERGGPRLGAAGWLILLGIGLNAAVCGVLSGPHPRYQGRVMWLVPMLAAALLLRERDQAGSVRRSA